MDYNISALGLEEAKIEAIRNTESPLLIIAAPGSGKTRTLIERILYLLIKRDVNPSEIMVATFTEKAANELVTRVSNRILELNIKVNLNEMYIGTLHSIFLRILEENRDFTRLKRNYRVLDDFEQNYLVYQNIRVFEEIENLQEIFKNNRVWDKTTTLVGWFNKLREEMVVLHDMLSSNDIAIKAIAEATILYSDLVEKENCIDFSGIQTEMYNMLKLFPDVTKQLQSKLLYLMIDEYQDTNTIQETILLKLAAKHNRICVVGDDDQSLYRFRGATVQNILSFKSNFSKEICKSVKLETNFRSHPEIIKFYGEWMKYIPCTWVGEDGQNYRFSKDIKAQEKDFFEYNPVVKVSAKDDEDAYHNEVYDFIQSQVSSGKITDYNQVAFLFRSVINEKVKKLSRFLESKGIPVYSPRSDQFFERDEIKAVIGAILTIFPDWRNIVAFHNGIQLSIWEYYEDCVKFFTDTVKSDINKHKPLLQFCIQNAKEYTPLKKNTPRTISNLFYELLQFPFFAELLDVDLAGSVINQRGAYNLSAFSQLLVKFEYLYRIDVFTTKTYEKHIKNFINSFLRFLIYGGITEYEGFEEYAPSGNVSFMTIHQSKGLEFPIVVVGSLNLNPRKQYSEIDEILQEQYYQREIFEPLEDTKNFDFWRLFYTAFSRAKNLLVLTGNEKSGHEALPSKAFKKIYENIESWRKVDLSLLPNENIKPVNLKGEYSFTSDILLYENCPLQYKFFKALEFIAIRHGTALFGNLVHQTIEDVHKTVLRGEEQRVTEKQIEAWFNLNYQSLSKTLRAYLNTPQLTDALKQVQAYVKKHESNWSVIKEAEVDVSLVKDDYILRGKVDLVRGENDTVEIVDFKTGKKLDVNNMEDRVILEKYHRQLEIYAHLIKERYGMDISKMHLYYTQEMEGIPTISYDYREASVDKSITAFGEVVSLIDEKKYDMSRIKKTIKLCENCDMQFYCNKRI